MFLPKVQMEWLTWGKLLFYMATVGHCRAFHTYRMLLGMEKVVWWRKCTLATIEAHSRALEPGCLTLLMWYTCGFMHNSMSCLHLSPGKTFSSGIYCKSISAHRVTSCLCSWWSSYKSVHICCSITFYYTFMILYRVDAPRRDQRTRSVNQLSNTSPSTQSDSIPVKSNFIDPAGKYFYNQIHGTLVQTHNLIIQNRRGNTYTIDFPKQNKPVLVTYFPSFPSEARAEGLLFMSLHNHNEWNHCHHRSFLSYSAASDEGKAMFTFISANAVVVFGANIEKWRQVTWAFSAAKSGRDAWIFEWRDLWFINVVKMMWNNSSVAI